MEHLETTGNILKSKAFYKFLLNRNVHQFIFIFRNLFYHEFSSPSHRKFLSE